jgi:hypothetical protein
MTGHVSSTELPGSLMEGREHFREKKSKEQKNKKSCAETGCMLTTDQFCSRNIAIDFTPPS